MIHAPGFSALIAISAPAFALPASADDGLACCESEIEDAAGEDAAFVAATMHVESRCDPPRSPGPAGELGPAQITPDAAEDIERMRPGLAPLDRRDMHESAAGAAEYTEWLRGMLHKRVRGEDLDAAVSAAWNGGIGNLLNEIEAAGSEKWPDIRDERERSERAWRINRSHVEDVLDVLKGYEQCF